MSESLAPDLERIADLLRRGEGDAEEFSQFGRGTQGSLSLYRDGQREYLIKSVHGRGPVRWLSRWMLAREYRAYRNLEGVDGVPSCFGLIDGEHLVLELLEATPYRQAEIRDRDRFFTAFLELIRTVHARGVVHGDIKGKNNIMVGSAEEPYLVDFGSALVRKSGPRPLHRIAYRLWRQMDFNAWVKHKYFGDYSQLAPEDAALFRRTLPERVVHRLRRGWEFVRWGGRRPVKRRVVHAPSVKDRRRAELVAITEPGEPIKLGQPLRLLAFDGCEVTPGERGALMAADSQPTVRWTVERADGTSENVRFGETVVLRQAENGLPVVLGNDDRRVVQLGAAEDPPAVWQLVRTPLTRGAANELQTGLFFGLRTIHGGHLRYAADTDGALTAATPALGTWESFVAIAPGSDRE